MSPAGRDEGVATPPSQQNPFLDEVPRIASEDVEFILRSAEGTDSIIVGGQALNLWVETYYDRAPEDLAPFAPYTSKDMDYWGLREAAEEFRRRVDGWIAYPPPFGASPKTAVVTFTRHGREIVVDFLATVAGLKTLDPVADTNQFLLPVQGEPGTEVGIVLLGPIQV